MRVGKGESLASGRVLGGRYKLEKRIGEGAFAAVWLASDVKNSDPPVAVKVFQPTRRTNDPSYLLRFRNEAELLTRLQHDAIAHALDTITEDGSTAMVLEYIEGRTLREEMLRRAKTGEPFELQEIGRAVDALPPRWSTRMPWGRFIATQSPQIWWFGRFGAAPAAR